MCFIHSRGVIHRDLKHANILIDSLQRAKIGDLSSALFVDADGWYRDPLLHGARDVRGL
jgi:serine/threonine protein kinase